MKPKNIINLLIILAVFIAVYFVNTNFVSATSTTLPPPAPNQFVINEANKQGGIYRAYDEDDSYELPAEWKIYEPKKVLTLKTPFGTCEGEFNDQAQDYQKYYQACAQKLGFTYVNYKNVPYTTSKVSKKDEGDGWTCGSTVAYYSSYQGFILNEKNKTLTNLINFEIVRGDVQTYPTEGQCAVTDKAWVEYKYKEFSESGGSELFNFTFTTPFGKCITSTNNNYYEDCSNKLGLTYVKDYIGNKNKKIVKKINRNYSYSTIIVMAILFITVASFSFVAIRRYKNKKNLPSKT